MSANGPDPLPTGLNRRKVLIGAAFATTAISGTVLQPRQHVDFLGKRRLEDIVPTEIGGWRYITASGLVVPPTDQLASLLYSQLLTRVYSDGATPPIMLLIAQSAGQTGVLQVHRPEFCYPAGGYTLSPTVERWVQLQGSKLLVNDLTATSGNSSEQIFLLDPCWEAYAEHLA